MAKYFLRSIISFSGHCYHYKKAQYLLILLNYFRYISTTKILTCFFYFYASNLAIRSVTSCLQIHACTVIGAVTARSRRRRNASRPILKNL